MSRGIPEIPLPESKTIVDKNGTNHIIYQFTKAHQDALTQLRQAVITLTGNQTIPNPPGNFKVTPQSLSNYIQFTRLSNADYYEVGYALTPSINDPHFTIVDIGNSASWTDNVGSSGITKYYWVRARKNGGAVSPWTQAIKATTTVVSAGTAQSIPPPPSNIIVVDQNGNKLPYRLYKGPA